MSVTVIGESNIDIAVKPQSGLQPNGCTPSEINIHHGGVARNIAHNLRLLGQEVRLMSVFGGDNFAKELIEDCTKIGMDLSLSDQFKEEKSPVFLSFNDERGNVQSAASDIGLNNRMNLDWVKTKTKEINRSDFVVADTLLASEALSHLIDNVDIPVFMDAVSPKRALRIAEALKMSGKKSFYALKCNRSEACAFSGIDDIMESARMLNSFGIQEVFVTMGADGVVYSSAALTMHFPALPAQVVSVTGSGDAFLAGIVYAYSLGYNGPAAIPIGLRAAQHNLESPSTVNPNLNISLFN